MHARMSMRWTVTLFTAFFLAASLSLVLGAMVNRSRQQWKEDTLIQARAAACLLARTSRDALRRGDTFALHQLVREVHGEQMIRRVIVTDPRGQILSDSSPDAPSPALLGEVPRLDGDFRIITEEDEIQVVAPVMDAATPLGAILIDISLREHHAVLDAVRQWGLLMALTTILIACTTAYFLAAVITRPLQRLAHGMRAVAEGIPAPPLDEGGCCEVRQMAKSFNGMARSLQRRLAEMESLRTLGSAVSRSLDLGTVIKSANQCIEAAIPGTRAQIWLCDHEGGHLIEGGRSAVDAEQVIDLESDTVLARALKSPVPLLAGADSEVPLDPWLAERYEATSVAAVPLRAGQERVGVLLACRQKGAPLTRANLPFLEAAGTEIALSIQNARMFHRESHVAQVFQRMLLPQTHTFIEQLEVAVRWRPASGNGQIGGDYYDFIALPGGRWGIVIGDVCGKGTLAASYTAMAKYALRSYAYETGSPAEILRRTNAALYAQLNSTEAHEGAPSFITMLCALYEPSTGQLVYSHAGHPLGTLARANSHVVITLDHGGPPVGVVPDATYREDVLYLAHGDSLALYTDGVVEAARSEEIIEPARIAELLRMNQENSVQAAADAVLAEAMNAAKGHAVDDTTLLVLRVRDLLPPLALPAPSAAETPLPGNVECQPC
jgi:sigma-B regulation protein RsbU (phosphoserine phosphatase)